MYNIFFGRLSSSDFLLWRLGKVGHDAETALAQHWLNASCLLGNLSIPDNIILFDQHLVRVHTSSRYNVGENTLQMLLRCGHFKISLTNISETNKIISGPKSLISIVKLTDSGKLRSSGI